MFLDVILKKKKKLYDKWILCNRCVYINVGVSYDLHSKRS
jgi:hypothetical protein